jgi:hypothetical protein
MLRNKPYRIPALIYPYIRLITDHIFLTHTYLPLPSLQTQCLLLPSTTHLPIYLLLYPPHERLHKYSEIVHREVMIVSVYEFCEEVEV